MSKKIKIGVSGEKGSFSEEAAVFYIRKNRIKNCQIEYLINMENVLAKLEKGQINLGIFPVSNTLCGAIEESISAMGRHNFRLENIFSIIIRQNLLVRKDVFQEEIKEITSQLPALKQCALYLKKNFKKARISEYADTAKAAMDLSLGKLKNSTAVIAPAACAKLYGLKIASREIQDVKDNYTTFLALKK